MHTGGHWIGADDIGEIHIRLFLQNLANGARAGFAAYERALGAEMHFRNSISSAYASVAMVQPQARPRNDPSLDHDINELGTATCFGLLVPSRAATDYNGEQGDKHARGRRDEFVGGWA